MDVIKATEMLTNKIDKVIMEEMKNMQGHGLRLAMDSNFSRGRITIVIKEVQEEA